MLNKIKNILYHIFYKYGYIRNYILFPICGFFRKKHIYPFCQGYEFIDDLRGKHTGKRCFILATGPSLIKEDVERLNGEITIAVNSFYKLFDSSTFRPSYYMVLDPDVQNTVLLNNKYPIESWAKNAIFMNSISEERLPSVYYLPYCYQNHWFKVLDIGFNHGKNLKFTEDILYGIYDKYTVTNAAIDMAIHMGCKEIYLLGVDCNYSGPQQYFLKPDKGTFTPNEIQAMLLQKSMMTGYHFMERETRKRGIKIFNATRGGMLEAFERVNFDDIV